MEWAASNGVGDVPPSLQRISPPGTNGFNHVNNGAAAPAPPPAQVVPAPAADPPAAPYIDCYADVRVLAQTVTISDISFSGESFKVFTELSIMPTVPDLRSINLHIGRQAYLPNEVSDESLTITVNDIPTTYCRADSIVNGVRVQNANNLKDLLSMTYGNIKDDDYNLRIAIPNELLDHARNMRCMKVSIPILVRQPKAGIQFNYSTNREGCIEKGAHLFTYRSSLLGGARSWLPCLDSPDQLALWRLNITCDAALTAVASAELMDVEFTEDLREKTYHYQQSVPTSACNMGFAIGNFITYGHPDIPEFTTFGLPGLLSLVKHAVAPLDKVFEYFEELLSCRYPFTSYKQVFVDKAPEEVISYSSLTIFSVNVLYHKKIIDVVQQSRQLIALGAAEQFFGCFIACSHFVDMWLVKSLSRLVTSLFVEKMFGYNEYILQIKKAMTAVIDYESQWGKVVLRPQLTSISRSNIHCEPRHEHLCSPLYADILVKKGLLVLRMLLKRIGHEPFFQVLHKILTVGHQMSERRDRPASWTHMIVSTESFFRTVTSVTGHEIPTFLEQWIQSGGHASFQIHYAFNRKRNMIELEVKQDLTEGNGRLKYVGPLTVVVQELDGSFSHIVQIDGEVSRSDLQCHSKGRRQKRKKVPLYTGEEVEVDLTNMDPDSPVLWIRADPEQLLLRHLSIRQPNYQWEYMLKYERDVVAQLQALDRLQQNPSAQSRAVLLEAITSDVFFYRVRCRASFCLSVILSKMSEAWSGVPDLIEIFRKMFGSKACALIPKSNNFVATSQYLQQYFLMQTLPQAVAKMRQANQSMREVQFFILELLRFNDNSTNRYSDDHYRAALVSALYSSVSSASSLGSVVSPDGMPPEIRQILKELTLALNMDTLKPSFGRVVGIAALTGIYHLQRMGHIPHDSKIFWNFATPKICTQMRKAALAIIVDRMATVRDRRCVDDIRQLFHMAEYDKDPTIRIWIPQMLATTPPFYTGNNGDFSAGNPCNTASLADELWRLVNSSSLDVQARMLYYDLYFSLYGFGVPPSKGGSDGAPGHHRLYNMASASSILNNALDDDRPESPPRRRNDSLGEDMLQ